ncbi:IclR family transcriptional regulator [Microvirga antarctica]|uniref:IclR family transcriptional regulator n=1 Tax=Microvirga antarctica TaxID=2819233 RepID=UPI001B30F166|nr:IclR family transcriptional regulator [Microvirga antarctica]
MNQVERLGQRLIEPHALDEDAGSKKRARVSGIERAIQILDHLQAIGRATTAYDIARAVGAPLSTIYTIVDDLVARAILSRDADNNVWLGHKLFHYGLAYARELDVMTVAVHEMNMLAQEVGETVQICGRDGDMMVVQAMTEGAGHFSVTSRVGTRIPLNWTASGRLLVARLSEAERVALFRRSAKASPTGRAITDPEILAAQSREAVASGISIQSGESDYAVACIAAPVRRDDGECVVTISIVLPEFKVRDEPERFVPAVRNAARSIEKRLGWQSGD